MIDKEILLAHGAKLVNYQKGEWIIREGNLAQFYFQISDGEVKMSNINSQGKEFVQGIFINGQSFGEPPLFHEVPYPASAIASAPSSIFKLSKTKYIDLLKANPQISLNVTSVLAKRLHYKAIMASEIASQEPEHRILTLLTYLKNELNDKTVSEKWEVTLTRQQIADMTGLRVETVIRSIKKMEASGAIEIHSRKVYI